VKAYEFPTLCGLILGPLSAVVVTLWRQANDQTQNRQTQTLRMLINTRHMVGDPDYSIAINMIPFDFNRRRSIMVAWDKYMDAVYYKPSPENRERHDLEMGVLQTKLIFEIATYLGYRISEVDLQRRAYASQSFVDRDQLNIQAQVAWLRIANALEQQNKAAGLPRAPAAEDLIPEKPAPTSEAGQ
jgi:hypothetical protein